MFSLQLTARLSTAATCPMTDILATLTTVPVSTRPLLDPARAMPTIDSPKYPHSDGDKSPPVPANGKCRF